MTAPSVPFAVWIWAAFDPVLIGVAIYLGWKADQAGKIFIAAIAALGASLLVDMALTALGIPWFAPLTRTGPMLLPVRSIAALAWAAASYTARRVVSP
ncbi:MAG TPA: hypothetical protein VGO82_11440 [Enterovirga sp.]|nr:hypothetical protein [Enterovirga sp.]